VLVLQGNAATELGAVENIARILSANGFWL